MIEIRFSKQRGHGDFGWLDAYYSFSFADYHDPRFMGFRTLRVINEDRIAGGGGFPKHPHKDMEIITYVVEGSLKHQDSMGHEGTIESGEVQKMTAGTGITHSEFNASDKDPVHLLQIWIHPHANGLKPSYQQHSLPVDQEDCLLPLPVNIHQDVHVYRGRLIQGKKVDYTIAEGRALWIQVIRGQIMLKNDLLCEGDGASVEGLPSVSITCLHHAEFLLFDLK